MMKTSTLMPPSVATARYTERKTHPLPEPVRDITQHTGNTTAAHATHKYMAFK